MTTGTIDDYLAGLDAPMRAIAERARAVIDAAMPAGTGALWHGHPVWSLGDRPGRTPVCLLKAYKSHVTFGLWRGQDITDTSGLLTAGARRMANLRLSDPAEVDSRLITGWLSAAVAVETE